MTDAVQWYSHRFSLCSINSSEVFANLMSEWKTKQNKTKNKEIVTVSCDRINGAYIDSLIYIHTTHLISWWKSRELLSIIFKVMSFSTCGCIRECKHPRYYCQCRWSGSPQYVFLHHYRQLIVVYSRTLFRGKIPILKTHLRLHFPFFHFTNSLKNFRGFEN